MKKKRMLAVLLSIVMVFSALPFTALAAGLTPDAGKQVVYLSFNKTNSPWGNSTEQYKVKLFKLNGTDTSSVTSNTQLTLDTDGVDDGAIYAIVAPTVSEGSPRIMHVSSSSAKTDQCSSSGSDTASTINVGSCTISHLFKFHAKENGWYSIESVARQNQYLNNHDQNTANYHDQLSVTTTEDQFYIWMDDTQAGYYYVAWTIDESSVIPEPQPGDPGTVVDHTEVYPQGGTNLETPFPESQPSNNYRIPSLITLESGRILAAADARWSHAGDAANLDTIISFSDDGGETWENRFANYFEDSTDAYAYYGSAFIDPAMIQDENGKIYLLADIWPGGVALNTAPLRPATNTNGYVKIDNKDRLALYTSADPSVQSSDENYAYYVGDFVQNDDFGGKVAPIYKKGTSSEPEAYVDEWYYIYDSNYHPITCGRLNGSDSEEVHANVFFWNAPLHVRATSHLWLVTSENDGETWSAPMLLNPMVRVEEQSTDWFYGVGPGRGLVLSDDTAHPGRVMFALYTHGSGTGDRRTSVIYSDDHGKTWEKSQEVDRQTSEATLVEADGKVYMFARHGAVYISEDCGESWSYRNYWPPELLNSCQIDAITYSEKINGKTAIILSGPRGSSRDNGHIWVGLVEADGSISWETPCRVNSAHYGYSCLTELEDGSLGLVYELANNNIPFENLNVDDIIPGAVIGDKLVATIPLYDTFNLTVDGLTDINELTGLDKTIVEVVSSNANGEITLRGIKVGSVSFEYNGVSYDITVSEEGKTIQEKTFEIGETYTVPISGDEIAFQNGNSVEATVVSSESEYEEAMVQIGTNASYSEDIVPLSGALYTAAASGDNWQFSATVPGTENTAYIAISSANPGTPHSQTAADIQLVSDGENSFTVQQAGQTRSHILYFWANDDNKLCFDRNSAADSLGRTSFKLYTTDNTGTPADVEILEKYGYYLVTDLSNIKAGQKYLITKQADNGNYYVLYPSLESNNYSHVAKIVSSATYAVYSLNIEAKAPGTTDIMVGNDIFRCTVSGNLGTMGDVNHDEKIDAGDATLVLQRYAGIIGDDYESYDPDLADVNGDKKIDAGDATLILQKYAGIITVFPADNTGNQDDPEDPLPDFNDTI